MSTVTILVFVSTFLSGVTAGAWLNDLANRPHRPPSSRR